MTAKITPSCATALPSEAPLFSQPFVLCIIFHSYARLTSDVSQLLREASTLLVTGLSVVDTGTRNEKMRLPGTKVIQENTSISHLL